MLARSGEQDVVLRRTSFIAVAAVGIHATHISCADEGANDPCGEQQSFIGRRPRLHPGVSDIGTDEALEGQRWCERVFIQLLPDSLLGAIPMRACCFLYGIP